MDASRLASLFVAVGLALAGCTGEARKTEKKRAGANANANENESAGKAEKSKAATPGTPTNPRPADGGGYATPNDLFHAYRQVTEAPSAEAAVKLFAPKSALEAAIDCDDGVDWWMTEIKDKATALAEADPSFHLAKLGSKDVTEFVTGQRKATVGEKLKILSVTKCTAKLEVEVADLKGDPPMPKLRMWRSAETGWFLDSYEPNPGE